MAFDIGRQNMVSSRTLATILGITHNRVLQLTEEGTLTAVQDGKYKKYDIVPAVHAYIDKVKTRGEKVSVGSLQEEKLQQDIRWKRARADLIEIELKELTGEMHRAEDVEAAVTDLVLYVKAALLAIPGRLATTIAEIDNAEQCSIALETELHEVLNGLAGYSYDPKEYQKRVRERESGKEQPREDEEEED